MELSRQGAAAGLEYEAIYLYSYPDPATNGEPWTIGGGHTSAAGGPKVSPGMIWSLRKCLEVYMQDMKGSGNRVERAIKRNLTQHAYDGFTNFDHNTGKIIGGTVDDKWNAGQEAVALVVLNQYVNAAGKRMAGLVTRRASETRMIRDGIYPNGKIILREVKGGPVRSVLASSLPWPDAGVPAVTAEIPSFAPTPIDIPTRKGADNFIIRFFSYLLGKVK